jgi:hypothetical protein
MPTALERAGDFSQTRPAGVQWRALVSVRDPLNGNVPRQRDSLQPRDPWGSPDEYLSAAQRERRRVQLPHAEPALTTAARALMRYDIRLTKKGHDRHQVSELVHQVGGMGGRRPLLAMGLVRQRYDFTADQGKIDWTRIWSPNLAGSLLGFLQYRNGTAGRRTCLASLQRHTTAMPPWVIAGRRGPARRMGA